MCLDENRVREICENNINLLAPIMLALDRGRCKVIFLEGDSFIIYDKTTNTYSLYTDKENYSESMLSCLEEKPELLQVFGDAAFKGLEGLLDEYPYYQKCVQGILRGPIKFKGKEKLALVPATLKDLPYIQTMYNDDCEEEVLYNAIKAGRMWVGKDIETGQKMCFGGIHIDDSLGFEYVEPYFRRKGYGSELICKLSELAYNLKGYKFMFIHALTNNHASISMLKKVGFYFEPNTHVHWIFNAYF